MILKEYVLRSFADTDFQESLNTLLVKYYNDLLDRQCSGRDRDEVTYFYVGDVFCIYKKHPQHRSTLALLCMLIFKKKSLRRFQEKNS